MIDREIIDLKVNLKDSNLTKDQQAKVYDFIEECHEAFSLCDEMGTCLQVGVHLKFCLSISYKEGKTDYGSRNKLSREISDH